MSHANPTHAIQTHTLNKFRVEGNHAYIALTNRSGATVAEAIVDREDLERVLAFARWHYHSAGYCVCTPNKRNGKRRVLLHRFVMNPPEGKVVDHIFGNGLDCRKSVLRVGSQAENLQNRRGKPRARSGFRNVHWQPNACKWQVKVGIGGGTRTFGTYDDLAVAAAVALEARRSLHPFCAENSPASAVASGVWSSASAA